MRLHQSWCKANSAVFTDQLGIREYAMNPKVFHCPISRRRRASVSSLHNDKTYEINNNESTPNATTLFLRQRSERRVRTQRTQPTFFTRLKLNATTLLHSSSEKRPLQSGRDSSHALCIGAFTHCKLSNALLSPTTQRKASSAAIGASDCAAFATRQERI